MPLLIGAATAATTLVSMALGQITTGFEAFGVLEEALHQLRSLHAHGVRGPVVHVGGGHELAALGKPRDEHGLQVRAGRVDRRAIARRARAEDEESGMSCRHGQEMGAKTGETAIIASPARCRMCLRLRGYLKLWA